jgi:hypothetical protein
MRSSRSAIVGLAVCFLLAVGVAASSSTAEDKDGYVSLFNGTDLTGWKASEGVTWKVEDGCIVTPPQRSHLFTEKTFKNFDLICEILTEPGSNSGVYFHTQYEETWPSVGYEAQVNCTHGDPVKNGSLYNVVKIYEPNARDNEWYTLQVTVKGKNIVTKVNGKVVVDYTEPEGVTSPRRLGQGSIALQAHDPKSVVKYRSVKIKSLD